MRVLAGIALCAVVAAGSADARGNFRAGGWTGLAVTDSSGRFSGCAMSARYRSGILLAFAIGREGRFRIALTNRNWNLQPGTTYATTLVVDRGALKRVAARAASRSIVRIYLPGTTSMVRQLQRGNRLLMNVGGTQYTFRLTGTAVGLQRLLYCVRYELALERGVRLPPFGTPVRRANATRGGKMSAARAELRLRATTMVANMINRAGLRNTRILAPEEAPKRMRGYDVVWRGPGVLGGLQIIPPTKHMTAERLTAALMASDAASCKGAFKSGLKTDALTKSSRAVRLFTDCRGLESWRSLYSILPIPKGGGYIMVGQFAEAATDTLEETDRRIVEALPAVLGR